MKDLTTKWLEIAMEDLDAAESMLRAGRYLYVAYMCQQALEKSLKAYIQEYQEELPPRIHNLQQLAGLAGLLVAMSEAHQDFLADLEPYYIAARYPEYREELRHQTTNDVAEGFLVRTRDVIQWLRNRLTSGE